MSSTATHENSVPLATEKSVPLADENAGSLGDEDAVPLPPAANKDKAEDRDSWVENGASIEAEETVLPLEDGDPSNEDSDEDGDPSNEDSDEVGDSSAEENTEEESLVSSMWETLNALPRRSDTQNGPTIFRVPSNFCKNKEHLIEPSVVSIGPYHRGRKHLAPMEDKKWWLLQDILYECNNKVTLKVCIEKIKGLQLQARRCYSERVDMNDDRFVEMLILDGTFIIQFLLDPFGWFRREAGWASDCIRADLILLENQIPFFVVQSLWDLYFPGVLLIDHRKLEIIRKIFCVDLTSGNTTIPQNGFHHLLHICHHCVVPNMSEHVTVLAGCSCFNLCKCVSSNNETLNILPCATELKNAGIKFRKKKPPCKMMDVTFKGGMLEIPFIKIYDDTKTLIINLLAFENSRVYSLPRHLTSYALFMDSVINTEHDVAILQRHGIIENHLSGEEEVALFFNHLCQGTYTTEVNYLSNLIKEVNRYYDSKCHRYRAKLMRDYFNSPWSLISFIAAVIILGLTFVQTYFASDAYFHPSPK